MGRREKKCAKKAVIAAIKAIPNWDLLKTVYPMIPSDNRIPLHTHGFYDKKDWVNNPALPTNTNTETERHERESILCSCK